MDNYLKSSENFDIVFDRADNLFHVILKVQFNWTNDQFAMAWTDIEKRRVQDDTYNLLLNNWSKELLIKAKGSSSFTQETGDQDFPVNIEVELVDSMPHLTIDINKAPAGQAQQDSILWEMRQVNIYVEDHSSQNMNDGMGFGTDPYGGSAMGESESLDAYWGMHQQEFSTANAVNSYSVGSLAAQLQMLIFDQLIEAMNDSEEPLVPETEFYFVEEEV